jgi:hypothetical protein
MSACINRKVILAYAKKDEWGRTDAEALERLFQTDWPKRIGKCFIRYWHASYCYFFLSLCRLIAFIQTYNTPLLPLLAFVKDIAQPEKRGGREWYQSNLLDFPYNRVF